MGLRLAEHRLPYAPAGARRFAARASRARCGRAARRPAAGRARCRHALGDPRAQSRSALRLLDVLVVALLEARRADRQEREIFCTYIRDALPAKRRDEHHVARRHLLRRAIADLGPTPPLYDPGALGPADHAVASRRDTVGDARQRGRRIGIDRRIGTLEEVAALRV